MDNGQIKQDENIVEVDFHDVIRVASGVDDDGNPNAAVSLAIYTIENSEEINADQEVSFGNAVTNIFSSGGCIVVQVDFPGANKFECHRAVQIAADWMTKMNSEEYKNKFLSLVIVPLQLLGQIYILLSELVYFTTFHVSRDETRLVMCFDNNSTQVFETDNIDINMVKIQVKQEIDAQEQELDDETFELQQQIKKLQEYNPFEEAVKREYGSVEGIADNKNAVPSESFYRPGYRFDRTDEEKGISDNEEENQ